jgi:hypothetical protein
MTHLSLSHLANVIAESRINADSLRRYQDAENDYDKLTAMFDGGYCRNCGANLPVSSAKNHARAGHKIDWEL